MIFEWKCSSVRIFIWPFNKERIFMLTASGIIQSIREHHHPSCHPLNKRHFWYINKMFDLATTKVLIGMWNRMLNIVITFYIFSLYGIQQFFHFLNNYINTACLLIVVDQLRSISKYKNISLIVYFPTISLS